MDETNTLKISVFNSDNGRKFNLYVREDRYRAFQEFLTSRRGIAQPAAPGMPGLSWAAFLGLDAIFERRPKSFPARDILQFIAYDSGSTPQEVESALELFSAIYPPDVEVDA